MSDRLDGYRYHVKLAGVVRPIAYTNDVKTAWEIEKRLAASRVVKDIQVYDTHTKQRLELKHG